MKETPTANPQSRERSSWLIILWSIERVGFKGLEGLLHRCKDLSSNTQHPGLKQQQQPGIATQTCNLRAMGRDKRVNVIGMGPWSFWLPISPGSHPLPQHNHDAVCQGSRQPGLSLTRAGATHMVWDFSP